MSLVYKKSVRENITDLETFVVDTTPTSPNYFRVSDVPQVLQKGKNLLRITAHPTNLVEGSQVYVDVRDSNGNPIYYEIPDYLEDDKSRVISIWIYHDKGEDNTPNGQATITLAGTTNVNLDGSVLPERARNKINVKWQAVVTVDRDRSNTSEIVFDSTNVPTVVVSQSIEGYQNQTQSEGQLQKTIQTGSARYVFSPYGQTPVIFTLDGTTFNDEMVGGDIILSNYTNPATPVSSFENPLGDTFFSSSIAEVILPNDKYVKTTTNYTTTFQDREDLVHTYQTVLEADYKVEYFTTASNITTENQRNFVNLSLSNIDPIAGVVDKVKILQKSDGLSGDYELLNEVTIPFTSSTEIKVPIPSKNLDDPKILKLQYLNSVGAISRTQTITEPFVFTGENVYIGGKENMISGSIFVSNTVGTGIEIGGASSGFLRSVGYEGQISASLGKAPGGFVIYSGSGNLVMGDDVLNGVGMQFVGDNDDRHLIFTTDDGGLLDVKTDKFFIGTDDTQFISGSDSNIEISSSLFHLDPKNETLIIGAGTVINADLSVDQVFLPATINGEQSNITNASASINSGGFARFVSASIGGWDVTTNSIEGSNLIMKPEGILQTKDYIPDTKGWFISAQDNGVAEFENIRIRGTLRTTTFEKESVNAVGGQLYVANSTTLTGSISESLQPATSNGFTSSTDLPSISDGFYVIPSTKVEVGGVKYEITSIDHTADTFETSETFTLLSESVNLHYTGSESYFRTGTASGTATSESIQTQLGVFKTSALTKAASNAIPVESTLISSDPNGLSTSDFDGDSGKITISGITFNSGTGSTTATYTSKSNKLSLKHTNDQDIAKFSAVNFSHTATIKNTTYIGTNTVEFTSAHNIPSDSFDRTVKITDDAGTTTYSITSLVDNNTVTVHTASSAPGDAPNTSGSSGGFLITYKQLKSDAVQVSTGEPSNVRLSFDNISPSASILTVDNVSGFVADEILTLKKITDTGFATEYVKVLSTERIDPASDKDQSGYLTVERGFAEGTTGDTGSLGDLASVAQSYEAGQVIVSTGREGTGYIRINANPNDDATPYIDIVERTGSGLYDIELKARLGDLSGLDGTDMVLGKSNPGFGLATDNVYLQGGISANFGDIGGFGISETTISSSNDNLILRDNGQITGSDVLLSGGTIGGFELTSTQINSTNDNLILNADGNITALGGNIGGFELGSNIISSSNGNLVLNANGNITALAGDIGGFGISATTISSSNDNLILNSNGNITALDGKIGGWSIDSSVLVAGSGTSRIRLSPTNGIHMGNNNFASAPFSVTTGGVLKATSGTIAGWSLSANAFTKNETGDADFVNLSAASTKLQLGGDSRTRTELKTNALEFYSGSVTTPVLNLIGDKQGETGYRTYTAYVVGSAIGGGSLPEGNVVYNPISSPPHDGPTHLRGIFMEGPAYEVGGTGGGNDNQPVYETVFRMRDNSAAAQTEQQVLIRPGAIRIDADSRDIGFDYYQSAQNPSADYIREAPALDIDVESTTLPYANTNEPAVKIRNERPSPSIYIDDELTSDEGALHIVGQHKSTSGPANDGHSGGPALVTFDLQADAAQHSEGAVALHIKMDGSYTDNVTAAIYAERDIITDGIVQENYSDARLKDFQGTIPDALDKVSRLNGYYYTQNSLADSIGYPNKGGRQVGVSAQEVKEVLPEIVYKAGARGMHPTGSADPYMTVKYAHLTPLLIEAIKELTSKVEALEARIESLENS